VAIEHAEGDGTSGSQLVFPCVQCGAELVFRPGTDVMRCRHCDFEQPVPTREGKSVVEHDFHTGLQKMRRVRSEQLQPGAHEVACSRCGARASMTGQADHCAFCGSPVVVSQESVETVIAPESILPFAVEERAVLQLFKSWVHSLWFAPNDLRKLARTQRVDGVYLPYWTYDAKTTTQYRGERGVAYYETQVVRNDKGERETREVRKIRWFPCQGVVVVDFDDVLVCATQSVPESLTRALEPWDVAALRPFEPGYLSGFIAQRATIDLEAGFEHAQVRMKPTIVAAIHADIGGDGQRIHFMTTRYDDIRYRHTLFPLWVSSFWYRNKIYRFVCNARTSEIAGERPYSPYKIAAAIVAALLVVAIVVYFWQRSKN
jgi:DNA-directed RNA polymerase subunit RPC12/RpoP